MPRRAAHIASASLWLVAWLAVVADAGAVGTTYPVGNSPTALDTTDYNDDHAPDVGVINTADSSVTVLLGTGNTGLVPQPPEFVCGVPRAITAANFNPEEDDYGDFAIACGDGNVTLLASPVTNLATGKDPGGIVAGELSGDGIPDIVLTAPDDNKVLVFRGKGDLSFKRPQSYRVGRGAAGVAVADLDRDGLADVAVANSKDDDVSVLFGKGKGKLGGRRDVRVGQKPVDVALGRFAGKPKFIDLLTANRSRTPVAQSFSDDTLSVVENLGRRHFDHDVKLRDRAEPVDVAAGDVDGDGIDDPTTAYDYSGRIATFGSNGLLDYVAGDGPNAVRALGLVLVDLDGNGLDERVNSDVANAEVNVYP